MEAIGINQTTNTETEVESEDLKLLKAIAGLSAIKGNTVSNDNQSSTPNTNQTNSNTSVNSNSAQNPLEGILRERSVSLSDASQSDCFNINGTQRENVDNSLMYNNLNKDFTNTSFQYQSRTNTSQSINNHQDKNPSKIQMSMKPNNNSCINTNINIFESKFQEFQKKHLLAYDNVMWMMNSQAVNSFIPLFKDCIINPLESQTFTIFFKKITTNIVNRGILSFCTQSCSNLVIQEFIKINPVLYITSIFNEILSYNNPHLPYINNKANGNAIAGERSASPQLSQPANAMRNDFSIVYNVMFNFAINQYGCYVFQKILDYVVEETYKNAFSSIFLILLNFFSEKKYEMAQNKFGNFVVSKWVTKISAIPYCPQHAILMETTNSNINIDCKCMQGYRQQFISSFFIPNILQILSGSSFSSHVLEHIVDVMTIEETIWYSCVILQVEGIFYMLCSEPSCFVIEKFASALEKNKSIQMKFIQQIKYIIMGINAMSSSKMITMKETAGKNSKGRVIRSNPINSVVMKMRSLIFPIDYNLLIPIPYIDYKNNALFILQQINTPTQRVSIVNNNNNEGNGNNDNGNSGSNNTINSKNHNGSNDTQIIQDNREISENVKSILKDRQNLKGNQPYTQISTPANSLQNLEINKKPETSVNVFDF